MEEAELSMLFRGTTAEECRAWQQAFRARLKELLGDSTPPVEWTIVEERRVVVDRRDDGTELFDMQSDPREKRNLASQHPKRVAELRALLQAHQDG